MCFYSSELQRTFILVCAVSKKSEGSDALPGGGGKEKGTRASSTNFKETAKSSLI